MALFDWMRPRNPRTAARYLTTLYAIGAGLALLTWPIHAQGLDAGGWIAATIAVCGIGLALASRRLRRAPAVVWALISLASIPIIAGLDIVTGDATVTGQVFFLFPALYGASQLRPPGAIVMTVGAVAGEWTVVLTLLPFQDAAVDGLYITAVVVTTAVLLIVANERHANLVEHLARSAQIDPLTGLSTRRALDEAGAVAESLAETDRGSALILLDVDHFKEINDGHGHPSGDAVLVQFADLMRRRTRGTDVACRLGGDELAIMLLGCSAEQARSRAEEIHAAVMTHPFRLDDGAVVSVSASVGYAHLPTHGTDLASLYSAADAALYRAKQEGRGQVGTIGRPVA